MLGYGKGKELRIRLQHGSGDGRVSRPPFGKLKDMYAGLLLALLAVTGCRLEPIPYWRNVAAETPDWDLPTMTPELPMGMNLDALNYYSTVLPFTDAMTTASEWLTTDGDAWDTDQGGELARDSDGYPTYLPQSLSGRDIYVRFLVNNQYEGKYRILFDGAGELDGAAYLENGKYYIDFDGSGENRWIDIRSSTSGNPVRNIRIVPLAYENGGAYPTFRADYLASLRPFHALRFMDWINTNNSDQVEWSDRVTATHYTQGGPRGTSFEYAIELCNELDADAWVCVPHQASDEYIRNMAQTFSDGLEAGRKVYLEYSNELWNWLFEQSNYVDNNAPGHPESYVSSALAGCAGFPEKDAYMMARAFRIWEEVFGAGIDRLVKVATGQASWAGNSGRILEYLSHSGNMCDALAVGGYFYYSDEDHEDWVSSPSTVTPGGICDAAKEYMGEATGVWARESAALARQYGVPFLVYEGGQHMQPYNQGEWSYNDKLYEAQIHNKMYLLYLLNFALHSEADVDCQLFMAYSHMGPRKSQWGSWGHLEDMSQIGSNYKTTAPKYQALLDFNTSK
jgi:hypothetical protein